MSFLQDAMENKKKFYIQIGLIGLCLVGAIIAYVSLSGGSAAPSETDAAAQQRVEEISATMQAQQAEQPSPPPAPELTAPRGRIPMPQ
ncbi:MAG: hypothetical protein SFY69_00170 [Planctomycetota bacterium]|nr:hypothetical protein [Planctomycetota bacterium]